MNDPQTDDAPLADQVSSEPPASDPPAPTFDALPLSDEVRRALSEMGYVNPTPVQLAVWEPATRGRDAVVQARTGTGKTASFGLPIIDHVVKRSSEGVQALVLTPTRELALQVCSEMERLAQYKGIKFVSIYGGAPMERQIAALAAGAQVVAGTPGRVLDHLRRRTLDPSKVRLLVLDEADEMLSMGFERELTAIVDMLPTSRQTLLFSATLPPDIERMARSRLKEPEFVTLSGDHIGALSIQHINFMVTGDKIGALVSVLETENPESALVFCNTRDQTEAVAGALQSRGYDADWLNGDLAQSDRERVMAATRAGKLRFLVATDVAARGIDLSHLTHVINFDFPMDAETYVHRTGRTGRAGRTGTAISLITPQNIGALYLLRLTYKIRPIERMIPSKGELKTRAEADLVGMLAEALLPKGAHPDDRALARRFLTHDQIEGILAGLLREYLGARPTAAADASQARRATPRRASFKRDGQGRGARDVRPPLPAPPSDIAELPTPSAASQLASTVTPAALAARSNGPARDAQAESTAIHTSPAARSVIAAPLPAPINPVVGEHATLISQPVPEAPVDRPRRDDRPRRPRTDEVSDTAEALVRDRRERPRDGRERDRRRSLPEGAGRRAQPITAADAPVGFAVPPGAGPVGPNSPVRDYASWSPPAEAGDDEPLIPTHSRPSRESRDAGISGSSNATPDADDGSYVELFMGVGRRDGVRAQDLLRVLIEVAGVNKDNVRRIRVRDRHAFVAVRREEATRAASQLNGSTIAGKAAVTVELARERPPEDPVDVPAS